MQITQAQVGNFIYPFVEGQPLPITIGETLKVYYSFKYKIPERGSVRIWASLYKYSFGIIDRQGQSQTKEYITLEKSLEWKDYEGEISIVIGSMPLSELEGNPYGLILELPDYGVEAEHHIDACIEVMAAPSIFGIVGPLLVLGLMAGVVSMMKPEKKK